VLSKSFNPPTGFLVGEFHRWLFATSWWWGSKVLPASCSKGTDPSRKWQMAFALPSVSKIMADWSKRDYIKLLSLAGSLLYFQRVLTDCTTKELVNTTGRDRSTPGRLLKYNNGRCLQELLLFSHLFNNLSSKEILPWQYSNIPTCESVQFKSPGVGSTDSGGQLNVANLQQPEAPHCLAWPLNAKYTAPKVVLSGNILLLP
jgi:hypothetical protein